MSGHTLSRDDSVGQYRIRERIGAGGMGEVFLATDLGTGREVAIKALPDDCNDSPATKERRQARFRREARALAALDHPGIVTLYELEEAEERTYLVMEYVRGVTLDRHLRGRLPEAGRFRELALALCDAIAAAHEAGITHRDIKPANIMVTRDGQVRVLDFGVARFTRSELGDITSGLHSLTVEGETPGTLSYMSPEQLLAKEIGLPSDVFSLGVTIYEMATGTRPFDGTTGPEITSAILRDEPRPLQSLRPDLGSCISDIIDRCLMKDPGNRFQNAGDLRAALSKAPVVAAPLEPLVEASNRAGNRGEVARRRAGTVTLVAVGAVALVVLALVGARGSDQRGTTGSETAAGLLELGANVAPGRLSHLEGSVRGPRFAPDGSFVVYENIASRETYHDQSALILRSLDQDEVTELASAAGGVHATPAVSPDGQTIAYTSFSRNSPEHLLYAIDIRSREKRQLTTTPASFPDWSPSGDHIVFSTGFYDPPFHRRAGSRLAILNLATTRVTHLDTLGKGADEPAWSPDGRWIAFSRTTERGFDISVIEADGDRQHRLTELPGRQSSPAWACDGRCLFFLHDENTFRYSLWSLAFDGSTGRAASEPVKVQTSVPMAADFAIRDLSSPSSLRFELMLTDREERAAMIAHRLGTNLEVVATDDLAPGVRMSAGASFSPTGALAYTVGESPAVRLYLRGPEDAEPVALTTGELEATRPLWTAKSDRIYFQARPIDENGVRPGRETWYVELVDRSLHVVAGSAGMIGVSISPDERWLAGLIERDEPGTFVLLDLKEPESSRSPQRFEPANPGGLAFWSPDSRRFLVLVDGEWMVCRPTSDCQPGGFEGVPQWHDSSRVLVQRPGERMITNVDTGQIERSFEVKDRLVGRYFPVPGVLLEHRWFTDSSLWRTELSPR